MLRSGEAFNVVPAAGELICDLRADRLEALSPSSKRSPAEIDGVELDSELVRLWPGMDTREAAARAALGAGATRGARAPVPGAAGRRPTPATWPPTSSSPSTAWGHAGGRPTTRGNTSLATSLLLAPRSP